MFVRLVKKGIQAMPKAGLFCFLLSRWDDYRLGNKLTDNALGIPLFWTLEILTLEISAKNIKVM